jgi:hypothetical protein
LGLFALLAVNFLIYHHESEFMLYICGNANV